MSFSDRLKKLEQSIAASNPTERIQRRADQLLFDGIIRPRVSGNDTEESEQARIDLAELERRHADILHEEPADAAMMLIVKQRMKARGGISI